MKEHISIVSHDSGGAEILSSWLNHNNYSVSVVTAGPAEKIFRNKCPNAEFLNLEESLVKSDWILTGTGWESNFERKAIIRARSLGIKSVSFLDHWVNYLERFKEKDEIILPDEIWVGDTDAKRIANKIFKKTPVLLKKNPYFEDLINEIKYIKKIKTDTPKNKILYVCEPIANHALKQHGNSMYWGYTEQDALRFFISNISVICNFVDLITIRPHPSEPKDKYKWAKNLTNIPIQFGGKKTLIEETVDANIVVGCESMAMVVGLLAKKRVISTIPPGGRRCQLPQLDIENLQKLVITETNNYD